MSSAEPFIHDLAFRPAAAIPLSRVDGSRHPVIRALAPAALRCVEEVGVHVSGVACEEIEDTPCLRFVLTGAIGGFTEPGGACTGFVGPGGLMGLEHCFLPPAGERRMVLLDAEWIEAPAAALVDVMGRQWAERLFAHQALGRLRMVAAEASCNARHPVPRRLARWLLRLHTAAGAPRRLQMTQALLARVLGVQRTTVNAEIRRLQTGGVIDIVRGRITVRDLDQLRRAACGCSDVSRLPAAMR
jgi:CRP-like cAMP-binding protein